MHLTMPVPRLPYVNPTREKSLANKSSPFNEIRGTNIACPGAAPDQPSQDTGVMCNLVHIAGEFPRSFHPYTCISGLSSRILPLLPICLGTAADL
jgi:hypothetical protein